jgi:hemerythrin
MAYKLEFPWYSSHSTGIFEVDNQHANIDILIQLFTDSKEINISQLEAIRSAIYTHFLYEEQIIGDGFPKRHEREHRAIILYIDRAIKSFFTSSFDRTVFSYNIQKMLLKQVMEFDCDLKKLIS